MNKLKSGVFKKCMLLGGSEKCSFQKGQQVPNQLCGGSRFVHISIKLCQETCTVSVGSLEGEANGDVVIDI